MLDREKPEIKFVIQSVRQSVQMAKRVQAEMAGGAITKKDRSPVTIGDFAIQALVAQNLEKVFPEDALVAEESAAVLRAPEGKETLSRVTHFLKILVPEATPEKICDWIDRGTSKPTKRFWTLDPIDGTKGFLRGEQYVVALALIIEGKVEIGALGCPHIRDSRESDIGGPGSIAIAVRGEGAWTQSLEGEGSFVRLHVSDCADPKDVRLLNSVETGHTNVDQVDKFRREMGMKAASVLMDSQAKHALLAAGCGDLLFRPFPQDNPDFRTSIWDEAAGSIIIEEAGGRTSDIFGHPLDFSAGRTLAKNRGMLLSNGKLHDTALAALKKIL